MHAENIVAKWANRKALAYALTASSPRALRSKIKSTRGRVHHSRIALLNPLADAGRKGDGNARFEVVQQTSRPNHFTVIEAWRAQGL